MSNDHQLSREIDGKARTVQDLLASRKYAVEYYQREFKWAQKEVTELIDDLYSKIDESHQDDDERSARLAQLISSPDRLAEEATS